MSNLIEPQRPKAIKKVHKSTPSALLLASSSGLNSSVITERKFLVSTYLASSITNIHGFKVDSPDYGLNMLRIEGIILRL